MSVQTLYTAATGMDAMQTKLDVIANNLANVNTTGFKKGRANFEDLFYHHQVYPGLEDQSGNLTATGTSIGLGTRVSSVQTDFRQGAFQETGNATDVAVEGLGFLAVEDPNGGDNLYTRAGNLSVNTNGELVLGSATTGRRVVPNITFPPNASNITISDFGEVFYTEQGSTIPVNAGQLQLASFVNPEGLLKLGENLYAETPASGTAQLENPGTNGIGSLKSGFLEASNVEPVQELIDLITTQRSFELNSQAIQVGDEILQLVSNLRRL